MGVLLLWCSLGLKLAHEKGSYDAEAVWIGTRVNVNAMGQQSGSAFAWLVKIQKSLMHSRA